MLRLFTSDPRGRAGSSKINDIEVKHPARRAHSLTHSYAHTLAHKHRTRDMNWEGGKWGEWVKTQKNWITFSSDKWERYTIKCYTHFCTFDVHRIVIMWCKKQMLKRGYTAAFSNSLLASFTFILEIFNRSDFFLIRIVKMSIRKKLVKVGKSWESLRKKTFKCKSNSFPEIWAHTHHIHTFTHTKKARDRNRPMI